MLDLDQSFGPYVDHFNVNDEVLNPSASSGTSWRVGLRTRPYPPAFLFWKAFLSHSGRAVWLLLAGNVETLVLPTTRDRSETRRLEVISSLCNPQTLKSGASWALFLACQPFSECWMKWHKRFIHNLARTLKRKIKKQACFTWLTSEGASLSIGHKKQKQR